MKFRNPILATWLLLAAWSAHADVVPCSSEVGRPLAAKLVAQCRQVSPATRPPCNANNACELILDEVDRGCGFLAREKDAPRFCSTTTRQRETLQSTLLSGGGTDDLSIVVFTEDGRRIRAYCDGKCGDWFETSGQEGGTRLVQKFKGRQLTVTVAVEANQSRIAGPGADEKLVFVRQARLKD